MNNDSVEPAVGDALDSAAMAFLWLDSEFRILQMNAAAGRLLEKSPSEAAGCLLWDAARWGVGGEFERRHREAMSSRAELQFESSCAELGVWLEIHLVPDGSGGLFAWYRNTGAERSASMDLRRREEEYRTILRTAMDGFWIMDAAGHFLDVNDAYCQLIGFSREELLGMSIRDLDATESVEETQASIRKVMDDGYGRLLVKHRRKDGVVLDVEVSTNYIAESGKFFVFLRDVTERNRVESALRESEDRYRTVAEHMKDVFYRTDMAGTIQVASPSAVGLFGLRVSQELVGRNLVTDGILLEAEVAEFFEILVAQGEVREHDMHAQALDGRLLEITTNSQWVLDESGTPIGVEGVFRDVTARKVAEREKAALEAQLLQSQRLESLGRLAGGIAHDFNNILTVINGHCELMLAETGPGHSLQVSLQEVHKAGERAAALTQQMLAFSRNQVIETTIVNLNQLLTESIRMVQRILGEDIELKCDLAPDLGLVMADSGRLHQILMNLMLNARDAMTAGGRILMTTRNVRLEEGVIPAGEYVQLEVADNGSGMDDEVRRRVFEPFFTTKEVGKGTGLGLSTVYGIVRQLDGSIDVQSQPGGGARFRIWLPRASGDSGSPAAAVVEPVHLRGGETVLIVEDQPEVRHLTELVLRGFGYDVLAAARGKEALEIAAEHSRPIHLLLTDIVMPGMSGHDLAERWRVLYPQTEVLLMSGYTSDELGRYGIGQGGLDLIWKPFHPTELATRVREMLDRRKR